jgi:hypothetical protein
MELLGVAGGDPDGGMAPLSDERWQIDLGQASLANVMRVRLYDSNVEDEFDSAPAATPPEKPDQGCGALDWSCYDYNSLGIPFVCEPITPSQVD